MSEETMEMAIKTDIKEYLQTKANIILQASEGVLLAIERS